MCARERWLVRAPISESGSQRVSRPFSAPESRIFEDSDGRMNLGLDEVGGAVLAVSQFTLAASIRKGRRPGFDHAMPGAQAEPLFDQLVRRLGELDVQVQTGVFGAMMDVELVNDGPVTLIWEDS